MRWSDWVVGIAFWLGVTAGGLGLIYLYPDAGPWVYRTMTPVAMAGIAVYSIVLIASVVSGVRWQRAGK